MKLLLLLVCCFLLPSLSFADVDLISWQPKSGAPKIILPKLTSEDPEQAVRRYLRAVKNNEDLEKLFTDSSLNFSDSRKTELLKLEGSKVQTAVIANEASDLTNGARISRFIKTARASGGEPVIIPISGDVGLSKKDASQYRHLIANKFDLLISLGGKDVDPNLYGEERTYAKDTNLTRDRSELELVKTFKSEQRGTYFGICRGHQLGAVADGHTLYQDIEKDEVDSGSAHIAARSGYSHSNLTWHHISVSDSLLLRFLNNNSEPLVTSVHHQAVRINPNADSFAVAYKDNVAEALQSKNGLSISVQFHPEFATEQTSSESFTKLGSGLIRNIFAYSRLKRAELMKPSSPRCERIFSGN